MQPNEDNAVLDFMLIRLIGEQSKMSLFFYFVKLFGNKIEGAYISLSTFLVSARLRSSEANEE